MTEYPQAVELIIMRGLPASGKSHVASNLMAALPDTMVRVSKDSLREMLHFGDYSQTNEYLVLNMRDLLVMNLLADDWSVIVDDTNLNPEHEERLRKVAKDAHPNVTVRIVDMTDVPIETCIERDANRAEPVGPEVIRSMAEKYIIFDQVAEEPDDG